MLYGLPPFYHNDDVQRMYHNILHAPIPFYKELFSREAMALISALLQKAPSVRARAREVKRSAFMRSVDWARMLKKEVTPPCRPQLTDEKDTRNFEGVEMS